jgi:ankyrin repeat protein
MEMLKAVLDEDSQKLEQLILANPDHINYPIGLPFDAHGGRFFNHPAKQTVRILQHPDQKILDIACAMPAGPVTWVLVADGAQGSTHPVGTDLALHNAIKNGRTYTVQGLIETGRSNVNENPGNIWHPLRQAVFWNVDDIVRVLLDRGATVNETDPSGNGGTFKTALQLALECRITNYTKRPERKKSERILKMLLDAGANVHVSTAEDMSDLSPFEMFLKPWQGNAAWVTNITPLAIECFEAFIRKGADLQIAFLGFPCSSQNANTFVHQVLWHSTPSIARLLVDHASPTPDGNGSTLLHEIVGCCTHTKRHPAETLRDIDVLLRRGADFNLLGSQGSTPLTACIEWCPSVDIVPRLKALLNGGADPELRDAKGLHPVIFAARTFDEPTKSQVMEVLLSKFRGRRSNPDLSTWDEGLFPIPRGPSAAQVLWYSGHSMDFEASMQRMLPEDVISSFRDAAFSVASKNYLDSMTSKARVSLGVSLTPTEKGEMQHIITMRQARNLPDYTFDQAFVMDLLMPTARPSLIPGLDITMQEVTETGGQFDGSIAPVHEIPMARPHTLVPPPVEPSIPVAMAPQAQSTARRGSASSTSSNNSASSFFVPSTTQIRWSAFGRKPKPREVEAAKHSALNYTCSSCNDGTKLTKAELKKHEEEHWHTVTCCEEGCRRRFCVAERG